MCENECMPLSWLQDPSHGVTLLIGLAIVWVGYRVIYLYRSARHRIHEMNLAYELLLASLDEEREPDLSSESAAAVQYLSELRAIIRDRTDEQARFLKFKRKAVDITHELSDKLERCRSLTETLPLMGIFGTVFGFLLSSGVLSGQHQPSVGGLGMALLTTLFALGFTIWIKVWYESDVVPLYFRLETNLQALEVYVDRYRGIDRLTADRGVSDAVVDEVR